MSNRTVYVSIGNSDDKLDQQGWAHFCSRSLAEIKELAARIHGEWYSLPNSRWQNMCVCFEIDERNAPWLKEQLAETAAHFRQDSIAWVVAQTEFIGPAASDDEGGDGAPDA